MPNQRHDMICARLTTALQPSLLELTDESHLHAGHAGAKSGGHFRLNIVSSQFTGLRSIARHQLVYRCLGDLMHTDIHALSITAYAPDEAAIEVH